MSRSTPPREPEKLSWWHKYLARILSNGPVPHHVAFILDGNRRWARQRNLDVRFGHESGAYKADWVGKFMQALGVQELTMYLFSIENFKRNSEEVDYLMAHLESHMLEFQERMPNAKYRVIGDTTLLSTSIQEQIEKLELETKDKQGIVINVAIAYTCRDDITQAIKRALEGSGQISVQSIEEQMYTNSLSHVDMLVRTSGETRLSDFLMWETASALLYFVDKLLPDVNSWDIVKCVLKYQRIYYTNAISK